MVSIAIFIITAVLWIFGFLVTLTIIIWIIVGIIHLAMWIMKSIAHLFGKKIKEFEDEITP